MDDGTLAVLVGGFVSIIIGGIPIIILIITNRNNAAIITAANDRADEVTERARMIAEKTEQVARDLAISNTAIAQTAAVQFKSLNDKADGIHSLVNSRYTKLAESLLAALKANLTSELRNVASQKGQNVEPSVDQLTVLKILDEKIAALEADILEWTRLGDKVDDVVEKSN